MHRGIAYTNDYGKFLIDQMLDGDIFDIVMNSQFRCFLFLEDLIFVNNYTNLPNMKIEDGKVKIISKDGRQISFSLCIDSSENAIMSDYQIIEFEGNSVNYIAYYKNPNPDSYITCLCAANNLCLCNIKVKDFFFKHNKSAKK